MAALLFGASTPVAKVLVGQIDPVLLAGLLYLGSGIGLSLWWGYSNVFKKDSGAQEAGLKQEDAPWLAGAILAGGIVAPLLLMWGLVSTPASTSSLLLNLEGVFTALIAWFVFKENVDSRIAFGMLAITCGGFLLSWTGPLDAHTRWGTLAIMGACLGWAIDNNLTRKVSMSDPVQIAAIKGLCAGTVNCSIALLLGKSLPGLLTIVTTGFVGFLGYGVSLTFFVLALRYIGTARTSAYFSTAPFVGAAIAILFLGDKLASTFWLAAILMAVGVWIHLSEFHEHEHTHEALEHEHLHFHDEHHQHEHNEFVPPGEPHTHSHRHESLTHTHPHYPDIHHRHHH